MNIRKEVDGALERLRGLIVRTPLVRSEVLSERSGADVHLKLETLQRTGSFKYRGALNRLLALDDAERGRGVVTASTGNHGLAVLRAAAEVGTSVRIRVPVTADAGKVAALRERGAEVVVEGRECAESEALSRTEAEETGRVYISAYNDPVVIGGQGTIAAEILEDLPEVAAVVASVGGGGLITGMAGYLAAGRPAARVLGAYPERSPALYESVRAGRVVDVSVEPTLSDATAGGVEEGAVTLAPARELVAGWCGVTEDEIAEGMRLLFDEGHIAEGAAGAAAAGALAFAERGAIAPGETVAVVLCGRNVDAGVLCGLVAGERGRKGDEGPRGTR